MAGVIYNTTNKRNMHVKTDESCCYRSAETRGCSVFLVCVTAQIQLCELRSADDDDLSTGRSTSSRPTLVVVKVLSQDATDKAR